MKLMSQFILSVVFQEKVWRNIQQHENGVFVRLPVSCAQCNSGAEKNPDAGKKFNYDHGNYSQIYGEGLSCFRHLTGNNILSPYLTQNDFISNIGYNSYVFFQVTKNYIIYHHKQEK